MNTDSSNIPYFEAEGETIICFEELELAFSKKQLTRITNKWNRGIDIELIAKQEQRNVDEVFLALFHQARARKVKRPFAFRKKQGELVI